LEATDVQSCTFTNVNKNTSSYTYNPVATTTDINIDAEESLPIGRYSLSCVDLDDAVVSFDGAIQCISNPDTKEI